MTVWDERARAGLAAEEVNTPHTVQRDLELAKIEPWLDPEREVLEAGCGNGWTTAWLRERSSYVVGVDYSEEMIGLARETYPNHRDDFVHADVRTCAGICNGWDCVVCIRVLINLPTLADQRRAIEALATRLRSGGALILVEGFAGGFVELDLARRACGQGALEPAPFNLYSPLADILPTIEALFDVENTFHLGHFDYLTRVCQLPPDYAAAVGDGLYPEQWERYSRIRGFLLRKRA